MALSLHVLLVEDSEDDAALLIRELQRGGYDPTVHRVETADAMHAALDAEQWDIVVADYVLPRFSALAALVLLRKRGVDLPFIIVSGSIGPGIAAAAVKAGAHDYFMKGETAEICAAIDRVMTEADERRRNKAGDPTEYLASTAT
jgi:two-component system, OmpR family, phosphate regulon sensor histidine kinase PhoR